jgi:hydrogenase expression/formation protein HypD
MKYIDEFRDGVTAHGVAEQISLEAKPDRKYNLMEFCGGHTHAIYRYGVQDLLPDNVNMIHGPGCPVCVLPIGRLDMALSLADREGTTLCTYGDMLRVPGSKGRSLLKAKSEGADIRMVYSAADALKLAHQLPQQQVVFFAIGFETTTPPTAVAIQTAQAQDLENFTVFCNHVLTPSAIANILESPDVRELGTVPIDGFLGPAHVSVVIGSQPYEFFAREYHKPVVISGFEPLDVMQSILMLIRQLNSGRAEVENQYIRAVSRGGNIKAKRMVAAVFELRRQFEWRGLGVVPYSALRIKNRFVKFDAEARFNLTYAPAKEHKGCECGAVLRGVVQPVDCKLFATVCTPETPMGSCMVSSEGACAAHYIYGRYQTEAETA